MKKLRYIGTDFWSRAVYEDENGKLWKDVDLMPPGEALGLCDVSGNEFDGEPSAPMKREVFEKCEFIVEE